MALKAGYKGIKNNLLNKLKVMLFISEIGDGLTLENGELSATGGGGGADLSVIAPAFSTETAYTAGEYVTYESKLYKFTIDHAAGAWDVSDVTEITVSDDLEKTYKTDDATVSAIVDADYIPFFDASAASGEGAPKKSTWSNFKAKLKDYFDDLYLTARYLETTTKTTSGDVDAFTLTDSSITTDTVVLAVACNNPMKNYTSITISTGSVVVTYSSADSISKVGFLLRG